MELLTGRGTRERRGTFFGFYLQKSCTSPSAMAGRAPLLLLAMACAVSTCTCASDHVLRVSNTTLAAAVVVDLPRDADQVIAALDSTPQMLRRRSRSRVAPASQAQAPLNRARRCLHDYENSPNGFYVFHGGAMRCDSECDGNKNAALPKCSMPGLV